MVINGKQFDVALTDRTPFEINQRFKEIVDSAKGMDSIDRLLSEYPHVPDFVAPYLKSIYCKSIKQSGKAADYMDEAIAQLIKDGISAQTGEIVGAATYMFIYRPFEKELWGQAGEIYSQVDRFDDAVNAYKKYQLQHCCIKGDDISGGLLSFRPISKYVLSDLINNEITVSSPRVMNDPFDTLLLSWGDYYLRKKGGRKHIPPYVKSFDYYRIRSFSKLEGKTHSKILSNVLMWSHYADKHTGMCIEYSFSPSFARTTDSSRVFRFRNVIYRPDKDKVSLNIGTINTDLSLLTKHTAWRYEKEVRLITYISEHEGQFVPIKLDQESTIKNIYFGVRCPQHDMEIVQRILAGTGNSVGFFKMIPNDDDILHLKATQI